MCDLSFALLQLSSKRFLPPRQSAQVQVNRTRSRIATRAGALGELHTRSEWLT
jgi:hypothetical protein